MPSRNLKLLTPSELEDLDALLDDRPSWQVSSPPRVESTTLYGVGCVGNLFGQWRAAALFSDSHPRWIGKGAGSRVLVLLRPSSARLVQLLALQSRTLRHQLGAGSAPSTPSGTTRDPGMSQTARLPPVRIAAFRGFRVTSPPWLAIPQQKPTIRGSDDAQDNLPR